MVTAVQSSQAGWLAETERLLATVDGHERWLNLVAEVHLHVDTDAVHERLVDAVFDVWDGASAWTRDKVTTITVPLDEGAVGRLVADFERALADVNVPTRLVSLDVRMAPAYEVPVDDGEAAGV